MVTEALRTEETFLVCFRRTTGHTVSHRKRRRKRICTICTSHVKWKWKVQAEKCKIINAELQDLSRNTNSRALFISAFNYSCTSTSTVLPFFFGLTCSELQKIDVRNGEIHSEAKQRTVRVRVKSNNCQFPISRRHNAQKRFLTCTVQSGFHLLSHLPLAVLYR